MRVACVRCFGCLVDREDAWLAATPGARVKPRFGAACGLWACVPVCPRAHSDHTGPPLPESQRPLPLQLLWACCPRGPPGKSFLPFPRAPGCPSLCSPLLLFPCSPAVAGDGLRNLSSPSAGIVHFLFPVSKAFLFPLYLKLWNFNITFSKEDSFLSILDLFHY